mmetsp:Transcript_33006/g.60496  ORF Transcript_33006/g.60496 Transcript_33006/m.60496 type:complete len:498 (+) Transcript_33006:69-1562(+)
MSFSDRGDYRKGDDSFEEIPFQRMASEPNPHCCMKRLGQCMHKEFYSCAAREMLFTEKHRANTFDLGTLTSQPQTVLNAALHKALPDETANLVGAIANCTNTIIGAGALAIPKTMGMTGIGVYHALVTAIFMVTLISLRWLIAVTDRLPHDVARNYEGVANYFLGVEWSLAISAAFFFGGLSLTMAYIILITSSVAPILAGLGFGPVHLMEHLVRYTIGLGVCWPLAMMRDISGLRFTSTLAIIALGYTVLFVTATSFQNYLEAGQHSSVQLVSSSVEFFSALAMSISAYSCHISVMPIYDSLGPGRNQRTMFKIVVISLLLSLAFYEVIGFAGYLQFGDAVDGNVLQTIATHSGPNIWVTVATLSIAITLAFSVPIIVWPLRSSILSTVQILQGRTGEDATPAEWQITTTAVMIVVLAIATVFPDVKTALSIGGSVGGAFIVFIYPAAFYLTVVKGVPAPRWSFVDHWPQLSMMVAGVLVGVLCLSFTVKNAVQSH